MPRVPRSHLPDGYFHVTARGSDGTAIFLADIDRLDFLDLLGSTGALFGWRRHAHCLMSTHYHLVVEAARLGLSAGMQRLNGVYAMRFNRRHGRRGHLFGDRFSSYVVRDEPHFEAAVEYVLQNPVRAGLCGDARDWRWSSAAALG